MPTPFLPLRSTLLAFLFMVCIPSLLAVGISTQVTVQEKTAQQLPATTGSVSSGPAYTISQRHRDVLTISPLTPTVTEAAQQQFTSNVPATWVASCGTIDGNGLYTAPLTAGSCTITATVKKDHGKAASTSTSMTITSPISITPAGVTLHALRTAQFTANLPAIWSTSCGTIGPHSGLFTAPASTGTCIVTATASGRIPYAARTIVFVDLVNYVSARGGHGNIGLQANETLLTPANVNAAQFGQKWIVPTDGFVYAQPLYINGLTINGAPHNVVFVATLNNTIYALDGDTGATLWSGTYSPPAVTGTTVDELYIPQLGILSTPVIDPTSSTLYFVTETADQCCDSNGKATDVEHRLHAVSLSTGNEKFNGPVLVSDPNLAPFHKLQRTALVLANGMVYIGFGSLGDKQPWNGLLFAFGKKTLAKKYVWNVTPSGSDGGIWMSGAPPAVDPSGNLYVSTGNGTFDGTNNYGEAAVRLSRTLQALDYFAPYNYAALNASDFDLGSGGIAMLPDQNGQYPHELIVCGKTPSIYVLNRDSLGGVGTSSDNVIQRLDHAVGVSGGTLRGHDQSCFATPTYWNNNVYFVAPNDALKMFHLNSSTGLLSTSAVAQGPFTFGWPGSQPVVSANGSRSGIVWTTYQNTGQVFANDASNVANQLFSATVPGGLNRLTSLTVVNGYVFVAGQKNVVAYTIKP